MIWHYQTIMIFLDGALQTPEPPLRSVLAIHDFFPAGGRQVLPLDLVLEQERREGKWVPIL